LKRCINEYTYKILNDAKAILDAVGMPPKLSNSRCVMTLAAFAELSGDNDKWRNASENYHGTHDIRLFINKYFPDKAGSDSKGYAENSRETFRDETIKPWIEAGILEQKPGLSTNDKANAYRFTAHFASLIRKYGTPEWEEALADYKSTAVDYAEYLKQKKNITVDYTVHYDDNIEIMLKKNPHNKLQTEILEKLLPLLSPKNMPELLYIGDASKRKLVLKTERLKELGINVFEDSSCLPDIVAYDKSSKRILFVEAYYSGGAFDVGRVDKILKLCKCEPGTEAEFVTAFDTTAKMLKAYKEVAWDTDIWTADEPTHLTHKNGDKLIGRNL